MVEGGRPPVEDTRGPSTFPYWAPHLGSIIVLVRYDRPIRKKIRVVQSETARGAPDVKLSYAAATLPREATRGLSE